VETVIFGRTGVEVSVVGLGCGGHSRLGQTYGATAKQSIAVVHRALDLGVNYIDTAHAYATEQIVGRALRRKRGKALISTKVSPRGSGGALCDASDLREAVHASLRKLDTDWIDVYHLHGVRLDDYDYCVAELVPELERLRDEGTIRFVAVSEAFASDPGHTMAQRAVQDDCWDVMMIGFNVLNPSARDRVFTATRAKDIAVEVMFAVRRVLSRPEELTRVAAELVADGHLDAADVDRDDPLGFLVHEGGAGSVVEASYRYARHEPGCQVVLTGTGNREHLEQNVRSINLPPLPGADLERLRTLFGHLDHLSGN
jgi:aryl-alcohol dehydrogenase-like predicted oxidoreductase